jgi:hypothetical protein
MVHVRARVCICMCDAQAPLRTHVCVCMCWYGRFRGSVFEENASMKGPLVVGAISIADGMMSSAGAWMDVAAPHVL